MISDHIRRFPCNRRLLACKPALSLRSSPCQRRPRTALPISTATVTGSGMPQTRELTRSVSRIKPSSCPGISRFGNRGSGYPDSLARKRPAPCPSSLGEAKDPRRCQATFVVIGEGWRHQRRRKPRKGKVEPRRVNAYKRGSSRNVRDWRSVPRDEEVTCLKGIKSGARRSALYAAAGAPVSEALMGVLAGRSSAAFRGPCDDHHVPAAGLERTGMSAQT